MDRFCPICKSKLSEQHMISFIDYFCNNKKDHHFSERLQGEDRKYMKFRVNPGLQRMYLKIYYDQGYMEVWEGAENQNRIRINSIAEPSFDSLEGLLDKLRTYVVFS